MFLDLAEGILEEFAAHASAFEAEYAQQLAALERMVAANEQRKEARRLRRAQERHTIERVCPHCGLKFSFTVPREDGRWPDHCSVRCGGATRKARFLAKVPSEQLTLLTAIKQPVRRG